MTTRDRLLQAAVAVGARDGWGGVTTRAVAAQAQVNPGLVHYHVGSVTALRREAVRAALATVAEQTMADLTAASDPRDAVRTLTAAITDTPGTATAEATAYVYEGFLAAARDAELRAILAEAVADFRTSLAQWVDRTTQGVPDRPDPAAVATVLTAAIDGLYLHRLLDERLDVAATTGLLARLVGPGEDDRSVR